MKQSIEGRSLKRGKTASLKERDKLSQREKKIRRKLGDGKKFKE